MEQRDNAPWYRQFWPWFILAILSWGVVSATITLSFALRNPPHMMTGDYARLGKALVDTHVRADRAEALGLAGMLTAESARPAVEANAGALAQSLLLRYALVCHKCDKRGGPTTKSAIKRRS